MLRRWYDRLMEMWAGQVCRVCRGPKRRGQAFCSSECDERAGAAQSIGF